MFLPQRLPATDSLRYKKSPTHLSVSPTCAVCFMDIVKQSQSLLADVLGVVKTGQASMQNWQNAWVSKLSPVSQWPSLNDTDVMDLKPECTGTLPQLSNTKHHISSWNLLCLAACYTPSPSNNCKRTCCKFNWSAGKVEKVICAFRTADAATCFNQRKHDQTMFCPNGDAWQHKHFLTVLPCCRTWHWWSLQKHQRFLNFMT